MKNIKFKLNGQKKNKVLIINRSFWPENDVIGEALLILAERFSKRSKTFVICLSSKNFKQKLIDSSRGCGAIFLSMKALTTSSSGLFRRILESFLFSLWVLFFLLKIRPNKIYFSTDPPLIVPFIVFLYSRFFTCSYYYHLQDIHPEATNSVLKMNKIFYNFLVYLDNLTINGSKKIITLSSEMKEYIGIRSKTEKPIELINNCAIKSISPAPHQKEDGFIFCGNIGRLQRIPILIESINAYLNRGGNLKFTFIGSGIHSSLIQDLANKNSNVSYLGKLPSIQAAEEIQKKKWAILSIEDQITKFAFPSKTSSYVINDCKIFAICGEKTSTARFVNEHSLGVVSKPFLEDIVTNLFNVENFMPNDNVAADKFKKELTVDFFVNSIIDLMEL
tara:strand:- start:26 stop:1198 length:1173 start_codon:yes stop_codon:yes gene_type:complete